MIFTRILKLLLIFGYISLSMKAAFAHGYQTAPYSRTAYTVDSGRNSEIYWNPAQISNNLPDTQGSKTLQEIINYASPTNGTGALAFFKDYYPIHNDQLCAYTANNHGYLPILNQPLPEVRMTKVNMGDQIQFKWMYTAWHTPSNNFVFMTEYPVGQYKPNPSLDDLHFVCAVTANSEGAWQCELPNFNGDSKQVIVTLWQRVDSAGENFISCADVKVEEGIVVPPENIWTLLGEGTPWTSTLTQQPQAGDLVNFTLESKNNNSGVKTLLATYSLSVTAANLYNWDSIFASKINNDTTHKKIVSIGQLNTTNGSIVYNEVDRNRNYVYLNNTVSDPKMTYMYTLTKEKDPNPITIGWYQVGEPLKAWVNSANVNANDQLKFSLQVAGTEQTLDPVTVIKPENAEKLLADAVNENNFNGLNVKVGVLEGKGESAQIRFVQGGANNVYVYRSSDNTTAISYVVRNITQKPDYPVYPNGIGEYKAGDLVKDESGQAYICLESGWCNQAAYSLASEGAWKAVTPRPTPEGYLTYPAGQPYKNGSIVANVEGQLYKCIQPGWCNDKTGVYNPGIGRAWTSAWDKF